MPKNVLEILCEDITACVIEGDTMIYCLEVDESYVPDKIEFVWNQQTVFLKEAGEVLLDDTATLPPLPDLRSWTTTYGVRLELPTVA